jgi:hypothetical protein
MTRPSPEDLLVEAAQLAQHYHWPLDAILDLEHGDRQLFLRAAEAMAGPPRQETWAGDQQQIDELWE